MQDQFADVRRQIVPADIEGIAAFFEQHLQLAHEERSRITGDCRDCPFTEGLGSIWHHHLRVDLHIDPEAGAGGAGSIRGVERKHARCDLRQANTAINAGEILAERQLRLPIYIDRDQSFTQFQCSLQGFRQTPGNTFFHDDPVDHRFNRMFLFLIELDLFRQLANFSIDPHPNVTVLANLFQYFLMLAFFSPNYRRQKGQLRPVAQRQQSIHHLLNGLLRDGLAALRAMWTTSPRIQESQVVVDFRHGSHSGTRIAARRLLVDRDGGRQPFDIVHIRLIHLTEELPGIG